MNLTIYLRGVLFALIAGIMACKMDDDIDDVTPNAVDYDFMQKASYANLVEIDFARMALTKSTNDSVKTFARMVINHHTVASSSLNSLGDRYNLSLPSTIDSAHAALKPRLMTLSGYNFDTAYVNGQVTDHLKAISLFQNEITNGFEPAFKKYATANLPILQVHLQAADSLRARLK